jgi:hypothetical protein
MDQSQQLKQFAHSYNIREVRREIEARSSFSPLDMWDSSVYDKLSVEVYHVPVLILKIDEKELGSIAAKVSEIDELMQDPECAKLLMEARFIHRLKRGFR